MDRHVPALAAAALCAGLLLGPAGPASAEVADPHAACPGLARSDHASPQGGVYYEGPGAIAASIQGVRPMLPELGLSTLGQVTSRWAKAHPGSHDPGCEQALLDIVLNP